jgi:hypothetical protein
VIDSGGGGGVSNSSGGGGVSNSGGGAGVEHDMVKKMIIMEW